MKKLKKLTRLDLKFLKGGISEECARLQAQAYACYSSEIVCISHNANQDCIKICNKWCY